MNELQNHNPAIVGSVIHKEFSFFCIQLLLVGITAVYRVPATLAFASCHEPEPLVTDTVFS